MARSSAKSRLDAILLFLPLGGSIMSGPPIEVIPIRGCDAANMPWLGRDLATRFLVWDAYVSGRMRVDLLLDEDFEWKACEINADCPGGHNESLGLPRLARAAGFTAGHDPSHVVAGLVARLRELA